MRPSAWGARQTGHAAHRLPPAPAATSAKMGAGGATRSFSTIMASMQVVHVRTWPHKLKAWRSLLLCRQTAHLFQMTVVVVRWRTLRRPRFPPSPRGAPIADITLTPRLCASRRSLCARESLAAWKLNVKYSYLKNKNLLTRPSSSGDSVSLERAPKQGALKWSWYESRWGQWPWAKNSQLIKAIASPNHVERVTHFGF